MFTAVPAGHLGKLVDRRYRLLRLVGEGASSWVFAAADERLNREVALKVFRSPAEGDLKRRRRCIAEGRTLAKLVHPHIVAVHDASEDAAGQAYLVMELCESGTLESELVLRKRLDLTETLRLVLPLMGALAFAHERDVIHRDIKPSNIVLIEERGERRCKLLDFGIALGTGVQGSSDLALGTPAYMAPEQVRGEPSRAGTDVWALGVVLFRCLTGELPFQADSSASLLFKIANERAPRLSSMRSQSSAPNLMRAIDRALEPDLERRYRDMRNFAYAIATASVLDGITLAQRPEPLGLPEFDAWVLSAKAAPATEPLPASVQAEMTGAALASRSSWARRSLVATALIGVAIGGALTLTAASAPERRQKEPRAPAHTSAGQAVTNAVPRNVVGAQRAASPNQPAPEAVALPASAQPAAGVAPMLPVDQDMKRVPAASRLSGKVRRKGAADAHERSSAQPATESVIRDWDW